MAFLATFALLAIPFVAVLILTSVLGIGTGFLLQWMLDIELGAAIISGMIAVSASLYFAAQIIGLFSTFDGELDDEDEEEPAVVYMVDPLTRRGRKKRKRK